MHKYSLLAFILLAFACSRQEAPQHPQGIRHVIVIGVDGMSPNGIRKANTPVMDRLMAEGAYTLHARAVSPSSSSSNWGSMIMGADVEQHGINSNDWERDDFILPPFVQGSEGIFPTIFAEIDSQIPNAEIGAIYHWGGFGRLFEKSAVDYDLTDESEVKVAQLAGDYIRAKKPTFCFIHLDHVDHAGHAEGHGTQSYFEAVSLADSLIGVVIDAISAAGMKDNTLVIIAADHGGIGQGHGGYSLAEMEIPLILWGKGVKKGYEIPVPVMQFDQAATVAFALGISAPYAWIGRPTACAFEGFEVPAHNYPVKHYLEAPVFKPAGKLNVPAGGVFSKETTLEIDNIAEGEVRFTTDGSLPTTQSTLYTAPLSLNSNAVVRAGVFVKGKLASEVSAAYLRFTPKNHQPGVTYTTYLMGEEPKQLPDFTQLKQATKGNVVEITSEEVKMPRESAVGVVFTSKMSIEKAGKYTFYTRSDDGSRLLVDGKQVVDNDGDHGVMEKGGSVQLEAGKHELRVEWFNGGGGMWLDVYVEGPDLPKQILPAAWLTVSP